jgi:hypothetical protein
VRRPDAPNRPAVYDFPTSATVDVYHEAAQLYYQRVSRASLDASVYRFGGVSAPGISDLDMVCVFPEGSPVRMSEVVPGWLGPEHRRLFCHPPLVLSRSQFHDVPLFYPNITLVRVGGPELPIRRLSEHERKLIGLMVGIEFLPLRWSDLCMLWMDDRLPVRKSLLFLASLRHSIDHLGEWGVRREQWAQFVRQVDVIRAVRSRQEDPLAIAALLRQSERVARELIVAHDEVLSTVLGSHDSTVRSEMAIVANSPKRVTVFTGAIRSPEFPVEDLLATWKRVTWGRRFSRPELSVSHPGALRHAAALLADPAPYAPELAARFAPPLCAAAAAGIEGAYGDLARERAVFLWKRGSLRPVPGGGELTSGLPGPLWTDVQQRVPYRPRLMERLVSRSRNLLREHQQRRVQRALRIIRESLAL